MMNNVPIPSESWYPLDTKSIKHIYILYPINRLYSDRRKVRRRARQLSRKGIKVKIREM